MPLYAKEMGGEVPNEDGEVDPLEGVAEVEGDSQTEEAAAAAACQMVVVVVVVELWMVVGGVGVLRLAEEVGARDLSGKMRQA